MSLRTFRLFALLLTALAVTIASSTLIAPVLKNIGLVGALHALSTLDGQNEAVDEYLTATYGQRSERLLKRHLAAYPSDNQVIYQLGDLYLARGQRAQAVQTWQEESSSVGLLVLRARHALLAEHVDDAARWARLAIAVDGFSAHAWYTYASSSVAQGDLSVAAEAAHQAALLAQQDSSISSDLCLAIGRLFESQLKSPMLEDALLMFDTALDRDTFSNTGQRSSALYNKGTTLRRLRRHRESIPVFEELLALRPNHVGGLTELGFALWATHRSDADTTNTQQFLEQMHRAEEVLKQSIQLNPESPWPYRHLGRIYITLDELDKARTVFTRVRELNPSDPVAENFFQRYPVRESE